MMVKHTTSIDLCICLLIVLLGLVSYSTALSDEELCHPHCLVTCLPSCQCCDSLKQGEDEFNAEVSRKNQLRLARLEQILKDKDLEVGLVCHSSCQKRCLPSCKFECCRGAKKKSHVSHKGGINLIEGFDLNQLMQSFKNTQKEYKKLEHFIKKVTSLPKGKHKKTLQIVKTPKMKKTKATGNKKLKEEVKHVNGRLNNIKMLENLVDLEDEIKDENDDNTALQNIDSPFQDLIRNKQKLKVELDNNSAAESTPSVIASRKQKTKGPSKINSVMHIQHQAPKVKKQTTLKFHVKEPSLLRCRPGCKNHCSPACDFSCCSAYSLASRNNTLDGDWSIPLQRLSKNNTSHSNFHVNQTSHPDADTLIQTKNQLQGLIELLKGASAKMGNSTINAHDEVRCHPSCKKECLPSCHFSCC